MPNRTFSLELILEALDGIAGDDDVREDGYSGKGMYGRTCAGIVFDRMEQAFLFFATLGTNIDPHAGNYPVMGEAAPVLALVESACTDSMGRGVIVYFPGWTFN